MKFIKQNWQAIVLFLLIGVVFFFYNENINSTDDAIATMMADKVMARERTKIKAIFDRYAILLSAKDKEIATWKGGNKSLSDKVIKKQKQLTAKVVTLSEAQAKLDEYRSYILALSIEYDGRLADGERLFNEKLALKDGEIGELSQAINGEFDASGKLVKGGYIQQIGDLTKANIKLILESRRKLIFGPQVGYGPNGGYVGAGITYELKRFKAPGLGAIL